MQQSSWLKENIFVVAAVLNVFAALFFSSPAIMRGFQRASFVMSLLFGLLFCGLGLIVAIDVFR